MQKPSGYDEVQVGGDFAPVELGGHHLIIKGVKEQNNKNGKPMVVVAFDFAKNDKQPGYFSDLFEKDIRPDKKWPFFGTMYINTMNAEDKVSKSFKTFITCVEKSNNMTVTWGDQFCDQFKDKKIGGVFGVVEDEYNGEIKKRHKIRWFCEDEKATDAKIPDPVLLEKPSSSGNPTAITNNSLAEEIPF